jgi:hypothetical protein
LRSTLSMVSLLFIRLPKPGRTARLAVEFVSHLHQ